MECPNQPRMASRGSTLSSSVALVSFLLGCENEGTKLVTLLCFVFPPRLFVGNGVSTDDEVCHLFTSLPATHVRGGLEGRIQKKLPQHEQVGGEEENEEEEEIERQAIDNDVFFLVQLRPLCLLHVTTRDFML